MMSTYSFRLAHYLSRLLVMGACLTGWTCVWADETAPVTILPNGEIQGMSLADVSKDLTSRYQGDGLSVTALADSVELRCDFQKLKGRVTQKGLQLLSSKMESVDDGLSMKAASVTRDGSTGQTFAADGQVATGENRVTYSRPGVVEEYSVSVEGVRQDFVLPERPVGGGLLRVGLDLRGATAETTEDGVTLVLAHSGRRVAYQRLVVTDANHRTLTARMAASATGVSISVDDSAAQYPVRIDPTFSDANWKFFGNLAGVVSASSYSNAISRGAVYASAVDENGCLYVGGNFAKTTTNSGSTYQPASGVAKWDGNSWTSLGTGVVGTVKALAVAGGNVYVGGDITSAGGLPVSKIAKWDGSSWSTLGAGMNQTVECLAIWKNRLYAGGSFSQAGGVNASGIAVWDGSAWSAVGGSVQGGNGCVYALVGNSSKLYVGGGFTSAGGAASSRIAAWDGVAWSALGAGVDGTVTALALNGNDLYVGGAFITAGNQPIQFVARWNGSAWSALANSDSSWLASYFTPEISSLTFCEGTLYVGGLFRSYQSTQYQVSSMLTWNGSAWKATQGWYLDVFGTIPSVKTLSVASGKLFVGGYFFVGDRFADGNNGYDSNGGEMSASIAQFSDGHWHSLGGEAASGKVNALVAGANGDMYLGGEFLRADGVPANHVAKMNNRVCTPLGEGVNGTVYAMAWWNNELYVGGEFTMAGGKAAANIAKWDGTTWSALGDGVAGMVTSLTVHAGTLVAGGLFSQAGGVSANYIARWNGSSWQALGSGLDSIVSTLVVSGSDLYVGGVFSEAGGVPASLIARWNGNSWSAVGTGLTPSSWFIGVNALTVSKGKVYVGGAFSMAGNTPVSNIACWNGFSWEAVGAGFDAPVNSLAVSGRRVFAGGGFQSLSSGALLPAGNSFNHLACWENGTWSPVSTGANSSVNAMTVSGDLLYLGGDFTVVGPHAASHLAALTVGAPPVITSAATALTQVGKAFSYQISASNAPDSYSALLGSSGGSPAPAPAPAPSMGMPSTPSLPPGLTFNSFTGLLSGTPTADGIYSIALTASNSAGDGVSTLVLTVTNTVSEASWAAAAGLSGNNALPEAAPFHDGVPNLLKYAFNMNGSGPDSTILSQQGVSGLPAVKTQTNGETALCVEFVRNKNRGLVYTPERSSDLNEFTPIIGSETVTPIDDQWERVVVIETSPPAGPAKTAFARVRVTAP